MLRGKNRLCVDSLVSVAPRHVGRGQLGQESGRFSGVVDLVCTGVKALTRPPIQVLRMARVDSNVFLLSRTCHTDTVTG